MRYVVGYQLDERGADAVALGVAIARAQDAKLDLMLVLHPDPSYFSQLGARDQLNVSNVSWRVRIGPNGLLSL